MLGERDELERNGGRGGSGRGKAFASQDYHIEQKHKYLWRGEPILEMPPQYLPNVGMSRRLSEIVDGVYRTHNLHR